MASGRIIGWLAVASFIAFAALLAFGLLLLLNGFDLAEWQEREHRANRKRAYLSISGVALLALYIIYYNWISSPLNYLDKVVTYDTFYDSLPKSSSGFPLPISGNAYHYLSWQGTGSQFWTYGVDAGPFYQLLLLMLGGIVVLFGKRMYRGFDFLFVPIGEHLVHRAVSTGAAIDGPALADALRRRPWRIRQPQAGLPL